MKKTTYIAASAEQQTCEMQEKSSNTDKTLSTPNDLLDKFPYAKEIGWTPEGIEFMFENKILKGEMNEALLIYDHSFEKFLNFCREQQESE